MSDKVLALPYRGAGSTISVIRDAALRSQGYYEVRKLVEEICQDIPSKDYVSEALAIFHFVCAKTRYMRDPRIIELVKAPHIVVAEIRQGKTPSLDCDDMACLIACMCLMAGCQVRIVTVAFRHMFYRGKRQYSHVFAEVREPRSGAWIALDPVPIRVSEMLRKVVAAKVWPIA